MAKIYAPNKEYTGISASVPFAAGVGETQDPVRLDWFRIHGYRVEENAEETPEAEGKPEDDGGEAPEKATDSKKEKAPEKKA